MILVSYTFAYEITCGMMIFAWGWSKRKEKTKILDSFAMEGKFPYQISFSFQMEVVAFSPLFTMML